MRRVLVMIARVVAAIPILVLSWSVDLGRFILKSAGWLRPAEPNSLVEEYVEMAKQEGAAAPKPDEKIAGIQQMADRLFRGEVPTPDMAAGLSRQQLQWLLALNSDMLNQVAKAKPDELRQHMAGRRTIRGLLASDPESVAAYQEALERDAKLADRRPSKRRTRREQPFPALGAMC